MADLKTKANEASVDEFIAAVTDDNKRADCHALIEMMRAATGEPPRMWGPSIIGFGTYHYRYETGREGDWPLVAFSPRAKNLTLYIMPGFGEYDALMARLGKHKTGKSCLYVNKLADLDLEVLQALIDGSVATMRQRYDA
ncbi:MAG: DUF1801 domain-containing protein [Myxococcales bacterium]|nr:DUF1801 domain-containing protein [Myxococcales bacterium]